MKPSLNSAAPDHTRSKIDKEDTMMGALGGVVRQMAPFALLGLSGAVVLAKLFEELAEGVFRKESEQFDNRVSLWVHKRANPALDAVFTFFTTLGGIISTFCLTLASFVVLMRRSHPHAAWLVVLANGGGVLLNVVLKTVFKRPRPQLWLSTERRPRTFSFPSGHSTVSLCFCASLSWLGFKFIKSPLALAAWLSAMVVWVVMVGLSRVYKGVHYMTDVVGGYISGGFWMSLLLSGITIFDRLHHRQGREKPRF